MKWRKEGSDYVLRYKRAKVTVFYFGCWTWRIALWPFSRIYFRGERRIDLEETRGPFDVFDDDQFHTAAEARAAVEAMILNNDPRIEEYALR